LVLAAGSMILGLYFCVNGVVNLVGGGVIALAVALMSDLQLEFAELQLRSAVYGLVSLLAGVVVFRWGRRLAPRAA
jgi:hypothetical protein